MSAEGTSSWKRRRVGERLGRYVLGSSIGAGGAASVYMARLEGPSGFERLLALKIVHEHLLEDKSFVEMFLDEANLTVRLAHPNIVHTYELARERELLFLSMEYLQGKPLSRVYARAFERESPLPYELVAFIGARAADALDYAHELRDEHGKSLHIVHRDVSPDNLFVTYDGRIKVIDFGIARAEGRLASTDLGKVKGKFRYMAPEYVTGRHFDHTLDLFALGATLYETALGLAAFEAEDDIATLERLVRGDIVPPRMLRRDFPDTLWRVIERALDAESTRRYGRGAEMAAELDSFAGLRETEATERLAACMRDLFAEEIAEEKALVTELLAIKPRLPEEELTPLQHQLSLEPARRSGRVRGVAVALGALAVLVPLAILAVGRERATPPEPAPRVSAAAETVAEARDVTIDVSVEPLSAPAEIRVAGQTLEGRPARSRLPRADAAVRVEVTAPGFAPARFDVVPDRDRALVVPLSPLPSAEPASTAVQKPSPPAARPSTVAAPRPAPAAAEQSDVIRSNPFGAEP